MQLAGACHQHRLAGQQSGILAANSGGRQFLRTPPSPPRASPRNQINKKNRQPYQVPQGRGETGEEVDSADIIKGYEVGKGQYIEIEPEELEAIAIESKRTIEIDEFVPKKK